MGNKFEYWKGSSSQQPQDYASIVKVILANRHHEKIEKLDYGDHGLDLVGDQIFQWIQAGKRIALYADYDVDGTMSCVSWIWFLQAIGYQNYLFYIPDRFKEGYGLNLDAVKYLINEERAEVIITMDTGITANVEAAYCAKKGVPFICTDHHKILPEKMPDCTILNPKMHPDKNYQDLCGCGITYVLLRKLGKFYQLPATLWLDILALAGMATICDVVPLGGVNHKIARMGVAALIKSQRTVLKSLIQGAALKNDVDEMDIGFRLGPRINAVGRLEHAKKVIDAFVLADPEPLVKYMQICNEERRKIQSTIVAQATQLAKTYADNPILFMGGDWHPGVVGIAASKISETYWKPTWLFQIKGDQCKGSARSIPGFDVTDAMSSAGSLFEKFGGHQAAGGFTFHRSNLEAILQALLHYANEQKIKQPALWKSTINYDCQLPMHLLDLPLYDQLSPLKPFGHGFETPRFCIEANVMAVEYYRDKLTGEKKHTAIKIRGEGSTEHKVMFFNDVHAGINKGQTAKFLVTVSKNSFRGNTTLALHGDDFEIQPA